jgi:hypothetical protein
VREYVRRKDGRMKAVKVCEVMGVVGGLRCWSVGGRPISSLVVFVGMSACRQTSRPPDLFKASSKSQK